jgi:hypothetical protein
MKSAIRSGIDARKMVTMSSFVIVDTTFRHIPTGGSYQPDRYAPDQDGAELNRGGPRISRGSPSGCWNPCSRR